MSTGKGVREGQTDLALPGEAMELLDPGAGYTAFEDAIVLLGVDVEGLLVEGGVILDLVDGGVVVAVLGFWVVEEEIVGGDGGGDGRRLRRRLAGGVGGELGGVVWVGVEVVEMGLGMGICRGESARANNRESARRTVVVIRILVEEMIDGIHLLLVTGRGVVAADWPSVGLSPPSEPAIGPLPRSAPRAFFLSATMDSKLQVPLPSLSLPSAHLLPSPAKPSRSSTSRTSSQRPPSPSPASQTSPTSSPASSPPPPPSTSTTPSSHPQSPPRLPSGPPRPHTARSPRRLPSRP